MKFNSEKDYLKGLAGAGVSYAFLKALQSSSDPYTRAVLGNIIGVSIAAALPDDYKLLGVGVVIGSALQGFEFLQGARLTRNDYPEPLYAIKEDQGILEIPSGQVPGYPIEGFTYKGLNGVYKLANGVHGQINQAGKISVPGLGAIANKLNDGGRHDKAWCEQTGDERWVQLYQRSV